MCSSRILLSCTLIFLSSTLLIAQEESLDNFRLMHNPSNTITVSNDTETIGTPLYNKDWELGHVVFASGSKSKQTLLIYNSFTNELFFKGEDEKIQVLDNSKLKGFSFDIRNEQFVFGYASSEFDFDQRTPLKVLYDGKTKLFVLHQTAKQSGNSKDPLTGKVTNRFIPFETILIRNADGEFVKTRIRKKNLVNDLGAHKKELEAFIKESKNKVKSEEDAAKIIAFFDTLAN